MPRDWKLRTVPAVLAQRYTAEGFWNDDSFGTFLARAASDAPRQQLRIWSETHPYDGTIADVHDRARRLAGGLRALGLGAGDVVSYQMPNHVEAVVTFWALSLLGAVVVPVVHFYGPKELAFILEQSGARAHLTEARWSHLDYVAGLDVARAGAPGLEHVVVVGDGPLPAGALRFADVAAAAPLDGPAPVEPDAPAVVAYTSGTTANPKGVVHSHRTLLAEVRQLEMLQEGDRRPLLIGAPVAHAIGMLGGLLAPVNRGVDAHIADGWDPARVLAAMLEADVNAGSGATYFFTSLLDHPDFSDEHRKRMGVIGLGGAPVPVAVGERAAALGITTTRSYGSTELPSTTGSRPSAPRHQRIATDGLAMPGVEVRIVDPSGRPVDPGEPGEILARGPELFLGYSDPALTDLVVDADGWYRTGDIAVRDEDGAVTITDRVSDIIIRGGTNVSAAEVEEQLMGIPGVAEVAVVAAPDERLGEHGCAFVRVSPGTSAPGLPEVRRHLEAVGLAKQKWPEEVRVVEDFPRTPSGKIKKFELRARCRE
jgi:acyl-CoA synthetase